VYAFSITIVGFLYKISTWAEIIDGRIHFKDGQLMKCTIASFVALLSFEALGFEEGTQTSS
jgi:hypothetical protein